MVVTEYSFKKNDRVLKIRNMKARTPKCCTGCKIRIDAKSRYIYRSEVLGDRLCESYWHRECYFNFYGYLPECRYDKYEDIVSCQS